VEKVWSTVSSATGGQRQIPYSVSKKRAKKPMRMLRCAQLWICAELIQAERVTWSLRLWRRFERRPVA